MRQLAVVISSLALSAGALWPQAAEACGGFFCSNVPVDQSGEVIVFDIRDGKVDAHVQIQYVGDAQDFAWVVPVHGVPNLRIGAPQFFQYVLQQTAPQFRLNWTQNQCFLDSFGRVAFDSAETSAGGAPPNAEGGVTVLAQGTVGPYDSAVISANSAQELADWLKNNGFNLQDPKALEPYVGSDYNFLALKLQKDKGVGELRPIVVELGGERPCVPIRLTAVAAQPDMPIRAFVFAGSRAVPINYRHVLVNETRINWINGGFNYPQVASRAVDEAGGQAFLTEFAGTTEALKNPQTWQLAGPDLNTQTLAAITDPVDFTNALFAQNFPRGDGALLAMFQKYIPLPQSLVQQGVQPQQFYNSMEMYRSEIENDPNRLPFDAAGFANELQVTIVDPLMRAHDVLKHQPYLTRLFTTMSAEEMTVDPEFEFNADAPTVSNIHTAQGEVLCGFGGRSTNRARITLSDGRSYDVDLSTGALDEGPFAERVEQFTESGAPALITSNSRIIDDVIVKVGGIPAGGGGCGGCGSASLAPMLGLGALALSLLGRRRRR